MVWESATPVDGFSSVVDSLAEHAVERLLTSLRPTRLHAIDDDAEWEALQSGLAAAVRDLVSDAKAAAEHLWSEAEEEYAERLRRQEDTYKVKLERSRTAATVQLQNQAVELEAEKHKELELTKKELIHDTNPQLAQAHDRIANLERLAAMHSQTREASMAELDKTSKKLEHVQFHLDRTEREFEELRELRQTESVQLTQNEALVQEVDERTGAGQRAHRVIEELSGSVKALEGSLREAAAAAERASMMQAEDAKRALEALAERMRDEVTRAAKGERESAQEQQQRFLDELRQQQRQHVNELSAQRQVQLAMEAQVESANSKLAQAVQAAKQSESDLEALRSAMGSDGEVVMRARAEVTAAKEDAEALRAQLARVSGMASVLQSKVPTLEAQVRELAASGDELRATLVKQAREAELSQREAVEATLAPWTERCMLAEERLKAKEAEVPPLQQRLDEAMQAAASHLSEKRSLAEQVEELTKRYHTAEAALVHGNKEVLLATHAMENAQSELERVQQSSNARVAGAIAVAKKNKAVVVDAALRALHQLRGHLTHTLTGLREQQQAIFDTSGSGLAFRQWGHRWGAVSATGDSVVVQFDAPYQQPPCISSPEIKPRPRATYDVG